MERVDLERFELGGLLGEGADMQVFGARDRETGDAVVVKRAHPSLVSRGIHDDVERRVRLQAGLRSQAGGFAGLPRLFGLTEPDRFAGVFGDDLGYEYSVLVEERAVGVPLIGSVADQVRGHPVGLPMNLYALHPSEGWLARGFENPSLTALGVIERALELGWLAGDLGPRNVFYAPESGTATVIDLGNLRRPTAATARRAGFDLNDVLLEFFQHYATPDDAPESEGGFAAAPERRLSGSLERMADGLAGAYGVSAQGGAARGILERVRRRGYSDVGDFRGDFAGYLGTVARADDGVWDTAAAGMRGAYWSKYEFIAKGQRGEDAKGVLLG